MKTLIKIFLFVSLVQCSFAQIMQIHTSTGKIDVQLAQVDSITFKMGGSQFNLFPGDVYVGVGNTMYVSINGGKQPYMITVQPNNAIATAKINLQNMIEVTGVAQGVTSLIVSDNSAPPLTAQLVINVTGGTQGLTATPSYLYLQLGTDGFSTITGGKTPYTISVLPDTTKAIAQLSGNTLKVKAVGIGTTSITIKDNSVPPQTVQIWVNVMSGPGGLNANPNYVSVKVNDKKSSTISGGNGVYAISVQPNSAIATAVLNGSTLTITGVGAGQTKMEIKDGSAPSKTVTVYIEVRQVFTTPGTLSFSSTVKNFSASGIFDTGDSLPKNTSGAGAMIFSDGMNRLIQVIGYTANTSTNFDVAMVVFNYDSINSSGIYPFKRFSDTMQVNKGTAQFIFVAGIDVNDTTKVFLKGYTLNTGDARITSMNETSIKGTFSGSGYLVNGGVLDMTKPITVSNGMFDTPTINQGIATNNPVHNSIVKIAKRVSAILR